MGSAAPTDGKTSKLKPARWRLTVPSKKAAKRLAVTLPAIVIVGAVAASQIHPGKADPAKPAPFQLQSRHSAAGRHPASQSPPGTDARSAKTPPKGANASRTRAPKWARRVSQRNLEVSHARKLHASRPRPACAGGGSSGPLPANYRQIVSFLAAHGYAKLAAAGIAGNIYQESQGNPESVGTGGGGLIGWTPLPAGFVTGNVAADLHTQLEALLTYNQQWAAYIPALNAATNPAQAAYIYMTDFERPGLPVASNREGAAVAVAQACGMMG